MRIARRDTYGIETVGSAQIRRRIFAGKPIPDHLEVASGDYEDPDKTADTAEKPVRRRGKAPQVEAEKDE